MKCYKICKSLTLTESLNCVCVMLKCGFSVLVEATDLTRIEGLSRSICDFVFSLDNAAQCLRLLHTGAHQMEPPSLLIS